MKWYSINKFTPPSCTNVFIRAKVINDKIGFYDRYFVGSIEDYTKIKQLDWWELSNSERVDFDTKDYEVTHFCTIDPIENED